jgi:hypothetical protein
MLMIRSGHTSDEELLARSVDEPKAFGEFYQRLETSVLAFPPGAPTSRPT